MRHSGNNLLEEMGGVISRRNVNGWALVRRRVTSSSETGLKKEIVGEDVKVVRGKEKKEVTMKSPCNSQQNLRQSHQLRRLG